MKCFYHHDRDAIGTCKSCQRGLCPECAVDLTKGLACKGHCEQDAQNIIQLVENNIRLFPTHNRIIKSSRRGGMLGAVFCVVMGAIFVTWGFRDEMIFTSALGICFAVFGTTTLIRVLRIPVPEVKP